MFGDDTDAKVVITSASYQDRVKGTMTEASSFADQFKSSAMTNASSMADNLKNSAAEKAAEAKKKSE